MSPESKILNARTLAAAFWTSYFALQWLILLEVVEGTLAAVVLGLHFLIAATLSVHVAAQQDTPKQKGSNGRKQL